MGIYVEFTKTVSSVILTNTARSKMFALCCTLHWYYTGWFSFLIVEFSWLNNTWFVTLIRLGVVSCAFILSEHAVTILTWLTPTKFPTGCRFNLGHVQTANDKKMLRNSRLPEAVYPAPAEFFMAMFRSLASERI